jgi:hypothetical protein
MSDIKLREIFSMKNKNLLVSLLPDRRTLDNGISISETRGKREIVAGLVEAAEASLKLQERCICYFPSYAANPIEVNGVTLFIVNFQDLVMTDKIAE